MLYTTCGACLPESCAFSFESERVQSARRGIHRSSVLQPIVFARVPSGCDKKKEKSHEFHTAPLLASLNLADAQGPNRMLWSGTRMGEPPDS
jgi:hypothetical protein